MPLFVPWSRDHLTVLVLTFAVPVLLGVWARRDSTGRTGRYLAIVIAVILLGQLFLNLILVGFSTKQRWQEFMPLHLCHLALFACVAACLTRKRLPFELSYFWGLAGTLQGLITPGVMYAFPSVDFFFFFLGHSGIVSTVFYLMLAFKLRPEWKSVLRAYLWILAYAVVVGTFNAVFDTNYGFLCAKPAGASLLDWLGPWPWYIASLLVIAFVNFVLLYLPWTVADSWRRRRLNE